MTSKQTKRRTPDFKKYIDAPRIQIVLIPEGDNPEGGKYETWLLLYVPDGRPPNTTRLTNLLSRDDAIRNILDIYTAIGEKFAFGDGEPSGTVQ